MIDCERRRAAVPRDLPLDGLSAGEISRLATEGAYQLTETKMMDPKMEGFIRHVLTSVGGGLVLLGYMDEGTASMVAGSVMTLIGFLWSYMSKA